MANELYIERVDAIATTPLESIPQLFDKAGIQFNDVACDNWNWSDRNPQVRFRAAHCGNFIALHFHLNDNELRAVADHDEGNVWEDSCCEFFVSPDRDDFYYNFECNCIGSLWVHGGRKGEDRPAAPAEVFDSVKRWTSIGKEPFEAVEKVCEWDFVEVIPATALFKHDIKDFSGKEMNANFYKCGDLLPHPHYLSWSPIALEKPAFHCPEFFGKITFK